MGFFHIILGFYGGADYTVVIYVDIEKNVYLQRSINLDVDLNRSIEFRVNT